MDFCWEKIRVTKFFHFHDQIFFTTNSLHFYDNFRLFNITNGRLSAEFQIPNFGSTTNDDNNQQQLRILWAFTFDSSIDDYCLLNGGNDGGRLSNSNGSSSSSSSAANKKYSYCVRIRKLSNTIVAQLSDMNVIYLSYRNGHLIELNDDDDEPFFEFESLVKHLNTFGSISSITFDNHNGNYYYSTHSIRLNQICMTRIQQDNVLSIKNMAIPLLKNLFRNNPYRTNCLRSHRSYNSLLSYNGKIYAIVLGFDSSSIHGYIDHIYLNRTNRTFEFKLIETESDKKFFNCYHNSSIININGQKRSSSINVNDDNDHSPAVEQSIRLLRTVNHDHHRLSSSSYPRLTTIDDQSKTNQSSSLESEKRMMITFNSFESINNVIFWLIITMLILFAVNFCMIKQSGIDLRWLIRHSPSSWDRHYRGRHNHHHHHHHHRTRDDGDVKENKKNIKKSISTNRMNKSSNGGGSNNVLSTKRKNDEKSKQSIRDSNHLTILANNNNNNNNNNVDKVHTKISANNNNHFSEFKINMDKNCDRPIIIDNNDHVVVVDRRKSKYFGQNIVGFLSTKTTSFRNRIQDYLNDKMIKLLISGDENNNEKIIRKNKLKKSRTTFILSSSSSSTSFLSSTMEEGFTPEDGDNDDLNTLSTLSSSTTTKTGWTSLSDKQTLTMTETESNQMMTMSSLYNDDDDRHNNHIERKKQDSLILIGQKKLEQQNQKQKQHSDDDDDSKGHHHHHHHIVGVKSIKITPTSLSFLSTKDDDEKFQTFDDYRSESSLDHSLPLKDEERANKMAKIKRLLKAELSTTSILFTDNDDPMESLKCPRKKT
ncbi:hypothetical protein DERF_001148 [Dermatophagoides farinae]|uniref:Uncharacterized protein n=1 Tax=Dermatophagoides farinae TaxID=6954 RepID=A0A922I9Y6_DERFA|nr:hypothetical protein DERF_001148 [Dermatophagoides farinae]